MPDARKKPRPNIWILATSNVDSWLHTPRTIVMLIAAVLLCMVETQKLFRLYTIDGYSLHLVESVFLLAYTGFNILMSSMMFLVTISELPMQISFQYYSLVCKCQRKSEPGAHEKVSHKRPRKSEPERSRIVEPVC